MGDRRDLADVAEKLVAQSFALARAGNEAGDIQKFKLRRHDILRFRQACDDLHAFIGHRHTTGIGLDRAERIVRGFGRRRRGECVKQGRFADIRQADNAALESHQSLSFSGWPGGGARYATRVMKPASSPSTRYGTASATASIVLSTQSISVLEKSDRT